MCAGTVAILVVLAFLLAASVAFAYFGLSEPGSPMPPEFFGALIACSVFSLLVGTGLMALPFYSHRKGYDEPPRVLPLR